jgi:hypothetical protein
LVVLAAADIAARGSGRGGGARAGGGGFSRGGAAAGGSFGQGRAAAGRVPRGAYRRQGPAASGTFEGRSSRGYEGAYAGGEVGPGGSAPQFDREAVAQQQRERFGRLGPAEGPREGAAAGARQDAMAERQEERQERRDEARQEWQSYDQSRREAWQDYADDHDDDRVYGYHGGGYYAYGTAVAAAGAIPPDWTLACTPAVVVVGATTYYRCGTAWYVRAYSGGEIIYTMVNPPAGY